MPERWLQPIVNCRTCGEGRRWWFRVSAGVFKCLTCQGNPLVENSGRADYKDFSRAKAIAMFGPRMEGDVELLKRYMPELTRNG